MSRAQNVGRGEAWSARRTQEIEEWTNLHVIHPLSLAFAKFFARLGIHPNAVSLTGMACGVGAGVAYHDVGSLPAVAVGFLLMFVWHVMDGADGQLARLTGRSSEIGKILDGLSDHVAFASIYVGLATALHATIGMWGWAFAFGAGISHFLQSTAYEFQRQSYDFWGRGKSLSRPEPPHHYEQRLAGRTGLRKLFGRLYLVYLNAQRVVAVTDPRLEAELTKRLADAENAERIRALYRHEQAEMVRRWSFLSSNYRTVAVFVACAFGQPIAFFLFEIAFLNAVAIVLGHSQRKRNRRLHTDLSEALEDAFVA